MADIWSNNYGQNERKAARGTLWTGVRGALFGYSTDSKNEKIKSGQLTNFGFPHIVINKRKFIFYL